MINAVIADDNDVLRHGLAHFLNYGLDVKVTEADSAENLLQHLADTTPDLLILSLSFAGGTGLDICKKVQTIKPRLPVILVGDQSGDEVPPTVLTAASAYISREAGTTELTVAIRGVLSGTGNVSPSLAERLVEEIEFLDPISHDVLSDREFQILCQIASGKAVGEIASELHLSVKTISTYRKRILEKMRLTSNADIMQYVLKHRLLETI